MTSKHVTAEELLKIIEELNDETKQKVLDRIYDEYFNGGGAVRHDIMTSKKTF